MTGQVPVDKADGRLENKDAGLAEALECHRIMLREVQRHREGNGELVGREGVLIQLVDVPQEARGAGEAEAIRRTPVAAPGPGRTGSPIVGLNDPLRKRLAPEGELELGEPRDRRRLL